MEKGGNIQKKRLYAHLMELGEIGRTKENGLTRFPFTKEDRAAKDLVSSYMRQAGLTVREDEIGNLIGRKEGLDPEAPAVLMGSHIDTVLDAGRFDGTVGVLGAIEVMQSLQEQGITLKHPVEVVAFTDEEGTRFGYSQIGSRSIAGTHIPDWYDYRDKDGVSIAEAMKNCGLDAGRVPQAKRPENAFKAYLELHIEQGKVLENLGLPVGIVSHIAGALWQTYTVTGNIGHAGSTPMSERKDAMVAAAKIIAYASEAANKTDHGVATVGKIHAVPGGINVIPAQVEFSMDTRHIEEPLRDALEADIQGCAKKVCEEMGVACDIVDLQRCAPYACPKEMIQTLKAACEKSGYEPVTLISGGGHDGLQFVDTIPVGMIFVRSKDGIGHSPLEFSSEDDCGAGAEVLYQALLTLAN